MFALRAVAIHEPAISQSTAANVAADSLVGIVLLLLHTICAQLSVDISSAQLCTQFVHN